MSASGILLLDKPAGQTSARALAAAKRFLRQKKAGHGGTLDPMASGLLPLLFGEATRYASYFLGGDKSYVADVRFGVVSSTDDACGELRAVAAPPPDLAQQVRDLLPRWMGDVWQRPPAYCALKHQGRPLYDYARRGQATPDKTRQVRIHDIALLQADDNSARLRVTCGGGVYIRALARDLGDALGCGAHLTALRREVCGGFEVQQAVTLERLQNAPDGAAHLLPVERALQDIPAITLSCAQVRRLGSGLAATAPDDILDSAAAPPHKTVRVHSPHGSFAGLAQYEDGQYRPLRFLHWTRAAAPALPVVAEAIASN